MIRRTLRFAAALAVALLLAAPAARADRQAPDCTLRSFPGEEAYALHSFRQGKVVWVDFWASWCGTCAEAVPFLNDLDREFRGRGLQVLGINLDEDPQDARAFLDKHPASFALAQDAQGDCPRSFGVEAMPSSYLIDRRGVIRHVFLGFQPGEAADLRAQVSRLLDEEPEAPTAPVGGGHAGRRAADD